MIHSWSVENFVCLGCGEEEADYKQGREKQDGTVGLGSSKALKVLCVREIRHAFLPSAHKLVVTGLRCK